MIARTIPPEFRLVQGQRNMLKRLFDIAASLAALILLGPIILLAALGVRLCTKGPAFYCAQRVGVDGQPFTLFKLRTMRIDQAPNASTITGTTDPRVFAFGSLLRKTKLDELPQLWNILRGDMSVVGPRPEDLVNVQRYYDDVALSTLSVRPGLSGVGSLYYYTHGEKTLTGDDPEQLYAKELLPIKIALEAVYIRQASLGYDLQIIFRTVLVIAQIMFGKTDFDDPAELPAAQKLLASSRQRSQAA